MENNIPPKKISSYLRMFYEERLAFFDLFLPLIIIISIKFLLSALEINIQFEDKSAYIQIAGIAATFWAGMLTAVSIFATFPNSQIMETIKNNYKLYRELIKHNAQALSVLGLCVIVSCLYGMFLYKSTCLTYLIFYLVIAGIIKIFRCISILFKLMFYHVRNIN